MIKITPQSIGVVVGLICLALVADAVIYTMRLGSESTTLRVWSTATPLIMWGLFALAGHIGHDIVPSFGLKPVPAHFAFFMTAGLVLFLDIWWYRALGRPLPRELSGMIGYLAGATLVPA